VGLSQDFVGLSLHKTTRPLRVSLSRSGLVCLSVCRSLTRRARKRVWEEREGEERLARECGRRERIKRETPEREARDRARKEACNKEAVARNKEAVAGNKEARYRARQQDSKTARQ